MFGGVVDGGARRERGVTGLDGQDGMSASAGDGGRLGELCSWEE